MATLTKPRRVRRARASRDEETGVREHVRSGTEAVDGLRGIAILLVVAYHSWLFSWLTPELAVFGHSLPVDVLPRDGYLGVDLFFAISGFVLFFPHALRALGQPVTLETLPEFARRRFFKIVPSYAIALVATLFFSIEYIDRHGLLTNFFTHAFFVQNFFDDGYGIANSVFWSLAIEVQFYAIFPAIAWAFRRLPIPTALALFAIAFFYRHAVANCCLGDQTIYRQLPAYLDLFGSGMLAAYGVVWVRVRSAPIPSWLFTIAAAACVVGAFRIMQSADTVQYVVLGPQRWDLEGRTLVALAAGGIIACSCLADRFWRRLVANPITLFLGIVSYNVYLWHTLLMIWMWKHDFPHAATANPHDDPAWRIPYLAIGWSATLVVATAITYFVERPLLATIKPQRFAFDWKRVGALTPRRATAPSETRT
jgi:peptidoglycan/LPS O-acetylase OafA/YrhL